MDNNRAAGEQGSSDKGEDGAPTTSVNDGRVVTSVSVGTGASDDTLFSMGYRCTASAPLPQEYEANCAEQREVSCEGNTPPRLGFPTFMVDGELVDDFGRVSASSRIALLIPFEDDECNLACGASEHITSILGEDFGADTFDGDLIASQQGCSSASTGFCFTTWMDTHALSNGPTYWTTLRFQVFDVCEAGSNQVSARLDFE